ncbi:MAG: hypothetical protein EHM43_04575 [Ignavibacteriae bacterium]|nr:MAG: hypothetical protein EHM43_04575 [Ignavibacteriota bacterium]
MRTFEEIHEDVRRAFNVGEAEELLRYAAELNDIGTPQAEAWASRSRGWALYLLGDYHTALELFHDALARFEELGDRSNMALVRSNIASVHTTTADYAGALDQHHRALAIYEDLGQLSGMALVMGNIGIVHQNTGDYAVALEHYHRSLALHEELGSRSGVARVTCNIGIVHATTGDHLAALQHYHRALTIHEELGSRHGMAGDIVNIGAEHYRAGDYSVALEHFNHALDLYTALNERGGVALVTGNIVETYLAMGSDAEAQDTLATMDAMRIDKPNTRINREHHRATLQELSGDLDGASMTLQHALAESLELGLRPQAASIHKSLRDLALKQNNLASYVEHNNEYTRITEEINGKETALKLAMQAKQREIDAREREHAQHMAVLHSTLPKHIADRVARGEQVNDHFDNAAVIFLDIVNFTTISDQLPSQEVVQLLDTVFTALDAVCKKHDVVKIKTIGDSYMAVAFGEQPNSRIAEQPILSSEQRAASAALDMLHAVSHIVSPEGSPIQARIGLHCGAVTAGVIGTERMQYDVWGDTVNVASRMESTSLPGRIHVSEAFATLLSPSPSHLRERGAIPSSERNEGVPVIPSVSEEPSTRHSEPGTWHLALRGATEVKGKGLMTTYWLEPTTPVASSPQ